MRIGIRAKLVATLIIAGVIPILITISITYFVERSQRRDSISKNFQQMSEKARENIALKLTANVRSISSLSELPVTVNSLDYASQVSSLSPKVTAWQIEDVDRQWPELTKIDEPIKSILENPLAETFRAFNSVERAFGEIFATDRFGQVVAATDKTSDYYQADEEWWRSAYDNGRGRLHLSEVTYDESVGIYSVGICVPVRAVENADGKERVVGIIKAVLATTNVFSSIYSIDVGEGGLVSLVSDDRTIVLTRGFTSLQHKLPDGVNIGTYLGDSDWLVGSARIELSEFSYRTPWSVVVYQELSHAFAPVRRLIWYIVLSGAALILVFFLLGLYLIESKVASPLSLLTETVKRVASGELRQTVEINSKDEIGELTSSFNQMISNLEKRISLDNMSLNMLSHLELSDVLSTTMETLKTTFDAVFARVWLVGDGDLCDECIHADICTDKERCLHLKVTVGIYAKDEEYLRVPLGSLRVGQIAESGRPYMTNDLTTDEWMHNAEWMQRRWIVSFAGSPLLIGGELLGVLALFRRSPMSNEEFVILGSFANRAAMAIQNARLHSEVTELNLNLEQKVEGRTEELRMANVKLRRADQLKSEFLANMSHELRTPLNAIIGFSEVLRDGLCGELNEEQIESILDIHGSGKHLLDMINDVLDISKIEAGRMELQPGQFSMAEAMNGIQSIVRDMVDKKGLSLQIHVREGLPDIHADHVKFKQIMYNLLSNAVKFTQEGGSITVDASLNDDGEFLISVTDTGIGISPGDQETIFDEFRQVDSSLSRQYEGTGLGLSLTKKLVELHGGNIWVESEGIGTGSRFCFTLPIGEPDVEPGKTPAFLDTGEAPETLHRD
ncbi:ATP-binding protein [Candidatus Poribacteria bacterium]